MKRALLAIFCSAFLLANPHFAMADAVFDQDMASRYLRAAQSGDDDAQFYLGALYSAGIGVPRSDEEAFRWMSRAAAQGHSHAMLILSGLYAVGRGVQKDNLQAYKWAYIVNGASRVEEFRNGSRQLLGVLEGRMSPDEVNYAKSEAGRWRPAVPSRPAQATVPPAPPIATAAPAAVPQPAAKPTSNAPSSSQDFDRNIKKGDVDSILDQVPQGLRKKFGF
jgi:Sel1 repeat